MALNEMEFQGSWRDYQARVLEELSAHLGDDHLHVVAAPGSGKTILGLETMRRLGQPSVIFAPSLTIRNQWVDRLVSMFLVAGEQAPNWISKDIRDPKILTVTTYQALHAAFSGEDVNEDETAIAAEEEEPLAGAKRKRSEAADVIALLKAQKVKTLIFDEAHHLRKEWWKALTRLKQGMDDPRIVSLTATPPYDVDPTEWQKYEDLCGPVDCEISIPELVKREDLCPHQDYVYFSLPVGKEAEKLRQFKGDMSAFIEGLQTNEDFFAALADHPWIGDTENQIEEILSNPKFFSSVIIFLESSGFKTPATALKILGARRSEIPELNPDWLEELLTGVLYTHADHFAGHENMLEDLEKELKRMGAIDRRKVILANPKGVQKMLASSASKLDSITEIAKTEAHNLGDNLRMVVLADFIRKSAMPERAGDSRPIERIGVVPVFEYLRRAEISNIKIGVLTGSLVIIPVDTVPVLEKNAADMGLDRTKISFGKLAHDDAYVRVDIRGEERQRIVHLITAVFNQGGITILVGTQALLGEGWDAPTVNTLVLASYVGSYMLSNQMRGRAIRVDPARPDKVSNIWHLVAIDLETIAEKIRYMVSGETHRQVQFGPFDEIRKDLGSDMRMLRRRFRAFEGLSTSAPPIIETGFKRLGLGTVKWTDTGVKDLNTLMLKRAEQRQLLPQLWTEALQGASPRPEMRERVESNYTPRALVFADTIKFLIMNAVLLGAYWGSQFLRAEATKIGVLIALCVAIIVAGPMLFRALALAFKHGSLEGSIQQVGWTVLETLQHMQLIKTHKDNLKIDATQGKTGVVHCKLDGATRIERTYFNDAMREALAATDSPRYLLVRTSLFGPFRQIDYHPVPSIIGQKKDNAAFYVKRWNKYVSKAELVYTRTMDGRLTLLNARTNSLSSSFQKKTDKLSVWE